MMPPGLGKFVIKDKYMSLLTYSLYNKYFLIFNVLLRDNLFDLRIFYEELNYDVTEQVPAYGFSALGGKDIIYKYKY